MTVRGTIEEARRLAPGRPLKLACDVAVVGSGAGGAVIATELSEAGLDVLVLEEGGHTPPEVYGKFRPSEALRYLGREAGSTTAIPLGDTPLITILMGRTVGGSSTMTGGVCFRVPESIAAGWVKRRGLEDLAPERMEPFYRKVEAAMRVSEVPGEMRSGAVTFFDEGARKLGFSVKPMRRNTVGCVGHSRCNFGCPVQAKQSVDLSYLPRARAHGARIWADCLVDRVRIRGGRAAGVEGRLLNGKAGKPGGRFEVEARAVFLCAGTFHTPVILRGSGVGTGRGVLGRNITLHPSFRVGALFDREVRGWDGAMQSAYSDHFEEQGFTLNAAFPPLSVVTAAMPGVGPRYIASLKDMGHLAMFGALVHDDAGGRLWRGPGREPWLTYRLSRRDKERFMKAIRVLAEAYFEAGARKIFLPIFGAEPISSPDGLNRLEAGVPGRLIETLSFHPLGSAPMGIYERRSIVQPSGESWDLPGLWVADGSIFPTSIGVNSQLPIMAMATRIASRFLADWKGAAHA